MGTSPLWVLVQAHPFAAVAVVFLLDGLGVPLLPELAVLGAFILEPSWERGAALLALAAIIEGAAAGFLHYLTGVLRLPRWLDRLMDGYSGSLLVNDERLILLNRIIPVLPAVGAFIRVRQWKPWKAILYVSLGSVAKYGIILLAAHAAYDYFDSSTALAVSLGLAGAFLAVSWGYSLHRFVAGRRERARLELEAA